MDKDTQRWLLSNVDPHGNPKWDPPTFEELAKEDIEGLPDDDSEFEYEEVYEGDQFFLGDTWQIDPTVEPVEEEQVDPRTRLIRIATVLGLFLLAALPRLYVLFFVTNPENPGFGWYDDVFHHWQVAFLSKEIGFSKGFLTLWDFKGMEYFWGLLHPLILAALFSITGSIDILVPRLLSVVCSSASIVLIFFLLRRYFNLHVALAGILLAIVNPVNSFGDSAGMQEPLGFFLLILGFYFWPKRAFWTGMAWGFAGMVRAEYWVFSAGLLAVSCLSEEDLGKKTAISIGWLIPSLSYMKYLWDKTGNAIYPIYWNFLGNAAGEWMTDRAPYADQVVIMWIARVLFMAAGLLSVWLLLKRHRSYIFLLLGLANILMLTFLLGFTDYILGVQARILLGRLVGVPYVYLGVFVSILLFYILPKLPSLTFSSRLGWVVIVTLAGVLQLAWKPVTNYYDLRRDLWEPEKQLAEDVAAHYQGGAIAIPENRPSLTYTLARYQGISAENLQSQMYDPFFYFEDEDPFTNWDQNRHAIADWIHKLNIRLLVFSSRKDTYNEMVMREEGLFQYVGTAYGGKILIYRVMSQ